MNKSTFFTMDLLTNLVKLPEIDMLLNKNPSKPISFANKEYYQNIIYNYTGNKNIIVNELVSRIQFGCMSTGLDNQMTIETISETYIAETIKYVLRDTSGKFDMLTAIQEDSVIALAIVNKGECGYYPDIFALQIICAGDKILSGSVLLAVYLLALKYNGLAIGLLELADGYTNLDGLCSYDKFGFIESYTIKHEDVCFFGHIDEYDTLPMFVDVAAMTPELILDTLVNSSDKPKIGRKEPLCNEFKKYIQSTKGITDKRELYIINNLNKFAKKYQTEIANNRLKGMHRVFGTYKDKKHPIYTRKVDLYKHNRSDPNILLMNQQIQMLQDENLLDTMKEIEKFKKAYSEYETFLRNTKLNTI